ncbi:MAG: T9SS type A sorting domain-containing protein [Bacteroidota bacterium]
MKRATTKVLLAFTLLFGGAAYAQPGAPVPAFPADGAIKVGLNENLIWNNTFTVDSFRLQIATDTSFNTLVLDTTQGATILYKLRNGLLSNYVNYYWRVQGIDMNGVGPWSARSTFRTIDNLPLPPALLKPTNSFKNTPVFPDFIWANVPRATNFQIQLSTTQGFNDTLLLDSILNSGKNVLEYSFDTLKIGTTYYWRMRSENEAGWGVWSNVFNFESSFFPPTKPRLLSPADGSVNQYLTPTFDWTTSDQTTRYRIVIATDHELTSIVYSDSSDKNSVLWFQDNNRLLNPSTTYHWAVAAGNDDNFYSRNSDTFSFTTSAVNPPQRPVNLTPKTASVQHSRRPTFTWAETGPYPADSFYLHISTFNSFTDTARLVGTTAPTYTIPSNSPIMFDKVHYWRVVAKNDGGFSPWSYYWNLTTSINNPDVNAFTAKLYPNPATTSTSFEFELKQAQTVRIAVTDISGREVLEVYTGKLDASKHNIAINIAELPAGSYYTVISGADAMQAIPFIKQ